MNKFLNQTTSTQLLNQIQGSEYPFHYDLEKHRITILDNSNNDLIHFRIPITIPFPKDKGNLDEQQDVNYVILLIQSGSCSMGYFENGLNVDHKVFRAYMVRKKQGKSQVKYLKTKGKSRAGSRVRLGETIEFFESINERLQAYFEDNEINKIAISCSKILIPYLYNSKVSTPFDKKDFRLFKIPMHIHTPIYEIMMDVNKFLLKGELIYEEQHQEIVEKLFEGIVIE